jgi:hypothetical protein
MACLCMISFISAYFCKFLLLAICDVTFYNSTTFHPVSGFFNSAPIILLIICLSIFIESYVFLSNNVRTADAVQYLV